MHTWQVNLNAKYIVITLKFIAGLLWVTGLWTVGVMPDAILPPLPRLLGLLAKLGTLQQRAYSKRQEELIQNLMQSQQYILSML
jgi:hypothetical protein